jgi:hypothetical protein
VKVFCSWCKRSMGEKMGPADLVTHGICIPCLQAELDKLSVKRGHPVCDPTIPLAERKNIDWVSGYRDGLD